MQNVPNYITNKFSKPHIKTAKLSGAAEARRAHNPEDTGSKPVSAIESLSFLSFLVTSSWVDGWVLEGLASP